MANFKISDYIDIDSIDGTELILVSKSGAYRKTTIAEIRNLAADISNTALADLVGKIASAQDVKNILTNINSILGNHTDSITELVAQTSENTQQLIDSTGYGIISGLEVVAQSTPNMTVSIGSGVVHLANGNRVISNGSNSISINVSDNSKPRKDIIYINSDGSLGYVSGQLGNNSIVGSETYTITTNAVAGDIFILNGVFFKCVASGASGNKFNVGSSINDTVNNLVSAINSHYIISQFFIASANGNVLTLTEKIAGGGNTPTNSQLNGSLAKPTNTMVIVDGVITYSTPLTTPTPIIPSGACVLAEILVKNGVTTITNDVITDVRKIKENNNTISTKIDNLIYNVKFFGAVGDGITDDTIAIQKAIDSGNHIYFPKGTYFISSTLTYHSDLTLEGDNATIIGDVYKLLSSPNYSDLASNQPLFTNIVVKNIIFKRKTLAFNEIDKILMIRHVDNFIVDNCSFIGWNGDAIGIDLIYNSDGTAYLPLVSKNIVIKNCIFDGVNNDNSQAIFILQGINIIIRNNKFINTSREAMPGAIDIEPWKFHTDMHIVEDISIIDNEFDNINGTGGVINMYIANSQDTLTYPVKNILVRGNKFSNCYGMFFYFNIKNESLSYWQANNIRVLENEFNSSTKTIWRFFEIHGINGIEIKNNVFNQIHGVAYIGNCPAISPDKAKNINFKFINNTINDLAPDTTDNWKAIFEIGLNDNFIVENNNFSTDDTLYSNYKYIFLFRFIPPTSGTSVTNYIFRNNICHNYQTARINTFFEDINNGGVTAPIMIDNILDSGIIEHKTS